MFVDKSLQVNLKDANVLRSWGCVIRRGEYFLVIAGMFWIRKWYKRSAEEKVDVSRVSELRKKKSERVQSGENTGIWECRR